MTRRYDESLVAIQEMQQAGTAAHKLDDMEFGRRLAVEREIEKDPRVLATISAVWDESGTLVLYPTLVGIKGRRYSSVRLRSAVLMINMFDAVVNTVTNRVVRLLGKDETGRWLNLALYQGAPAKKTLTTIVRYPILITAKHSNQAARRHRQWQRPLIPSWQTKKDAIQHYSVPHTNAPVSTCSRDKNPSTFISL